MTERPVTVYLGSAKGRWAPASWSDVLDAAAGGLLDESHWIDLKRELSSSNRNHNTELAKDLASLAVDGGVLMIGIEDNDSRAGRVSGVPLAGLADRVDQVARDKVRPSLTVRSQEIPDPDHEGWGCLLIHVPPSPQAPHMVDYVYYGRGDRANIRLADEQVRMIIEKRSRSRTDVVDDLRRMADDDPIIGDERQLGHLYVLAQPEVATEDLFLDLLTRSDAMVDLQRIIGEVRRNRGRATTGFAPDADYLLHRIPRAEGMALTSYSVEDGPGREEYLLELVIREDGGIRLICGRGTPSLGSGVSLNDRPQTFVIVMLVLGLTHLVAALGGRLADEFGAYQGQWRLGVRLDRLRGVLPADSVSGGPGNPYSRDDYEKVTSASTEELINSPHAVAERLLAYLLRGLGIAHRYLPYNPD